MDKNGTNAQKNSVLVEFVDASNRLLRRMSEMLHMFEIYRAYTMYYAPEANQKTIRN